MMAAQADEDRLQLRFHLRTSEAKARAKALGLTKGKIKSWGGGNAQSSETVTWKICLLGN